MKPGEEKFQIVVRHSENLTEEEEHQIEAVDHLAFSGGPVDDYDWSSPEWFVFGKFAGRVVSIVGILKRRIQVGDVSLEVGGVGGVATHPDFQHRGFASAVLRRTAAVMYADLGVDFGLLVCDQQMVPFYSKLGWQIPQDKMVFDFRGEKHTFDGETMVLVLGEIPWPQGPIDLCGPPW